MSQKLLTRQNLIARLKKAIADCGGNQSEFGRKHGLSRQAVNFALRGGKPSPQVLRALGVRRAERYEVDSD